MFKTNLQEMLAELQNYKRDKSTLKIMYIQDRLTESINSYNKELNMSLQNLRDKNERRILRRLKQVQNGNQE